VEPLLKKSELASFFLAGAPPEARADLEMEKNEALKEVFNFLRHMDRLLGDP
jgi:hypothetical protein